MRLLKPSLVPPIDYEVHYFPEMDRECAVLGLVSLVLALINIICIFLAALVVLKIKEVAPITNMAKTSRFWKEDIKIARDYNTSMPAAEAEELGQQFLAEWATLNGLEPDALLGGDDAEAALTRLETLKDIMQDVENDPVFQTVARSVSCVADPRPLSQRLSVMTLTPSSLATSSPAVRRKSEIRSWLRSSLSPHENGAQNVHPDPSFKDVELRRPYTHSLSPSLQRATSGIRGSVAVLRQSLMTSDNPYTLWPSAKQESANKVRFLVTPVAEEALMSVPTSPMRHRRVSRFLQDPCVIVKETTC
ncbi:uncharacterized protein LOC129233865 [Uloborus diversus]|nr:uncharacterized protein LOC129233865 [Uloborus diversus]